MMQMDDFERLERENGELRELAEELRERVEELEGDLRELRQPKPWFVPLLPLEGEA